MKSIKCDWCLKESDDGILYKREFYCDLCIEESKKLKTMTKKDKQKLTKNLKKAVNKLMVKR